jgi:hypothetical protein
MMPLIKKKLVNFKVTITEMHRQISWEMVADPIGSVEHTLGTTGLEVPFSGVGTWLFQSLHTL